MARPSESIPPLARESGVLDEFAHTSLDVDDGDEVEDLLAAVHIAIPRLEGRVLATQAQTAAMAGAGFPSRGN